MAAPFDAAHAAVPSSALEAKLFADAADGRLDDFSPFDAALIASGVSSTDALQHYRRKAAAYAEQLRRSCLEELAPRALAEVVFTFMHQRLLHGYQIAQTDLRATLDQGRFNCVSASVLYNYLAEAVGLRSCGLAAPGHAMSRVFLSTGALDVETTCPRWFRVLDNPQQRAEMLAKTSGVPTADYQQKIHEVTPLQMTAMIYYNHGVDLLAINRFADAAAANAKAVRLDPQNDTARGNLLATLNNWSIDLSGQGRFEDAVALLRQGLAMAPQYEAFAQNFVHVHHEWVGALCRAGRFAEAQQILAQALAEMPNQQYLRRAQSEVSQQAAQAVLNRQTHD